jgi:hypothetical protein
VVYEAKKKSPWPLVAAGIVGLAGVGFVVATLAVKSDGAKPNPTSRAIRVPPAPALDPNRTAHPSDWDWTELYLAMRKTFDKGELWTAGGGSYMIEPLKNGRVFVIWTPPSEARGVEGYTAEGLGKTPDQRYDDAVYKAAADFFIRWNERIAYGDQ